MKKLIPLIILLLCSSVSAEEYIIDYTSSSLPTLNEALRVSYAKIRDLEDATIATIITGDTSVTTGVTDNTIVMTAAGTQEAKIDANGITLKAGASVNEFSTDTTMAGNSDDAVPTEKAVKAYADGGVKGIEYIAGSTYIIAEANTEQSGSLTAYTKVKEIAVAWGGTIEINWEMKVNAQTGRTKIYVNGAAIGTEKSSGSTSYLAYQEATISVEPGDLVQLYYSISSGAGIEYVQNFNIKSTVPEVSMITLD